MAKTASKMVPLGRRASQFQLPDVRSGKLLSWEDCASPKGTVIVFFCNHCPFVKLIEASFARVAQDFRAQGISFVAISANDAENYPEDAPEELRAQAERLGFEFPYLYDETQEVAKAYEATCTPDFFVFDGEGLLVYRGQYDSARPGNEVPVTGQDLRAALEALLEARPPLAQQQASIGCNIKWKSE